jgi:hypothetical protein
MRRVALISALLLPLPFAALPLFAVLMDGGAEPRGTAVVLTADNPLPPADDAVSVQASEGTTIEARFDAESVAYGLGCEQHGPAGS